MARKPREVYPGATYHVTSRCHNRQNWLKLKIFKTIFMGCIRRAQAKYDFKLIHFVIMNNHFHLIIQTKKNCASISKIMQFTKGTFAQKYNKMMGQTGSFWNERFKSSIIEKGDRPWQYFIYAILYISYNPVKSGQVSDPRDYYYSSFRFYVDKHYKPPLKLDFHEIYLSFGDTFEERRDFILQYEKRYREYLGLSGNR
jgi:putative transposase